MILPVLTDKTVFPTEDIIFGYIGKYKQLWISLFDFIQTDYPGMAGSCNYYNDGKSWLFKLKEKSNTIFWLSLTDRTFGVTFYFNPSNELHFYDSPLSDDMKRTYKEQNARKKIKPVTVFVKRTTDIDTIKTLIAVKRMKGK